MKLVDLAPVGISVKDEPGRDPLPRTGSRPAIAPAATKVKQELEIDDDATATKDDATATKDATATNDDATASKEHAPSQAENIEPPAISFGS